MTGLWICLWPKCLWYPCATYQCFCFFSRMSTSLKLHPFGLLTRVLWNHKYIPLDIQRCFNVWKTSYRRWNDVMCLLRCHKLRKDLGSECFFMLQHVMILTKRCSYNFWDTVIKMREIMTSVEPFWQNSNRRCISVSL